MDAVIEQLAVILIYTVVYLWFAIYAGVAALGYHIIRYTPTKTAIESFMMNLKQPVRGTYNYVFSSSKKSFTEKLFKMLDERTHVKYKISIATAVICVAPVYIFFAWILINGVVHSSNLVMKFIYLFTLVVMLDNIRRLIHFGSKLKPDTANVANDR